MTKDTVLYDALGVDPGATSQQIKYAFLKNRSMSNNENKSDQTILEVAYEVLTDEKLRELYNENGFSSIASLMDPCSNDISEEKELIDESLSKNVEIQIYPPNENIGKSSSPRRKILAQKHKHISSVREENLNRNKISINTTPKKSYNKREFIVEEEDENDDEEDFSDYNVEVQEFRLDVSLKDLYKGCTLPLKATIPYPCSHCLGTGTQPRRSYTKCHYCQGSGSYYMYVDPPFGQVTAKQTCINCYGRGYIVDEDDICCKCLGKLTVNKTMDVNIRIEKGSRTGDIIKVKGLPHVRVVIYEKKHPVFERVNKDDLLINKVISLSEALLGTKFIIETLDGRKLLVSTHERVIKSPDLVSIPNEGFPIKGTNEKGKMYIYFEVDFSALEFIPKDLAIALEKNFPTPKIETLEEPIILKDAKKEDFGKPSVSNDDGKENEESYDEYETVIVEEEYYSDDIPIFTSSFFQF